MYKIHRQSKRVPSTLNVRFESYDKARQAVRKWLIAQWMKGKIVRHVEDRLQRSMAIGYYGFHIRKDVKNLVF